MNSEVRGQVTGTNRENGKDIIKGAKAAFG